MRVKLKLMTWPLYPEHEYEQYPDTKVPPGQSPYKLKHAMRMRPFILGAASGCDALHAQVAIR